MYEHWCAQIRRGHTLGWLHRIGGIRHLTVATRTIVERVADHLEGGVKYLRVAGAAELR